MPRKVARALDAQVGENPTLHDAEERLIATPLRGPATGGPGVRACQGSFVVGPIERLRAFIQAHDDVGAQVFLAGDGALRREAVQAAVDVRAERHAVGVNFSHLCQTEDLEAARVGQHRPWPAHEAVQAAEVRNQSGAGAQIEMVGIG